MNGPLQDKINEMVEQYRSINQKIEVILMDLKYANHEGKDYVSLMQERQNLVKRLWLLKQNWD